MPTRCWKQGCKYLLPHCQRKASPTKQSQSQCDFQILSFLFRKTARKVQPRGPRPRSRAASRRGVVRVLQHGKDEAARSADSLCDQGGSAAQRGEHPVGVQAEIGGREWWGFPGDQVPEISARYTIVGSFVGTKRVDTAPARGGKIVANAQKSRKSELLLYFTREVLH